MDKKIFESNEYKNLLKNIGVLNKKGDPYEAKHGKFNQIEDYILQLYVNAKKLSSKRKLVFVDCACGKCYISFAANYVLNRIYKMNIEFICIDYCAQIINSCKEIAHDVGFDNMQFICVGLEDVKLDVVPDILYSLHACDSATDMAAALGINTNARIILTVSCCQHSVKDKMRRHPLANITCHGVYKERIADMLSDSMRALVLESRGYKTKLFEFTSNAYTPKNVMIRAVKTGQNGIDKFNECEDSYSKLKEIFNTEPKLKEYLL